MRIWTNRKYGCGSFLELTPDLQIEVEWQGTVSSAADYGKYKVTFAGYTLKERFITQGAAQEAGEAFARRICQRILDEQLSGPIATRQKD